MEGHASAPIPVPSELGEAVVDEARLAGAPGDTSSARALRSGAFALGGHVTIQALRMAGQIVLTRLLPREAFGLMAIVHAFRAAIDLFSDIGIGPSIIQNERGDDPRFLNTAWTIQLGRGILLFVFAVVCALPAARFYGHAELEVLIPVASFAAVIAGLQSTKVYAAERHLALGRTTLIEIFAQCSALATMLVWAVYSPTVWALVAGGLVGALVDVVFSHVYLPGHNPRPGWEGSAARSLTRFGKWIFLSTVLTFAVNQADRLVFGKMTSLADLGIYHVALTIASIPTAAMHSVASRVIFPLFSQINQAGESLVQAFRQARRLHLVLSGWALSGLMGGGQAAIGLIYSDAYAAGGWMLQLLALGAWLATPEATNSSASMASGHPRWVAAANLAKLMGMLVLLPLGYRLGGFPGALLAYAASELFRYAASTLGVYRRGLRTLQQDLGFTCVVAASAVLSKLAVDGLAARGVHVVLQALSVFALATLIWSPWLLPYVRAMLRKAQGRLAA